MVRERLGTPVLESCSRAQTDQSVV